VPASCALALVRNVLEAPLVVPEGSSASSTSMQEADTTRVNAVANGIGMLCAILLPGTSDSQTDGSCKVPGGTLEVMVRVLELYGAPAQQLPCPSAGASPL
jgi:hypothetical protein